MINTILVEDDLYIQKHFVDRLAADGEFYLVGVFRDAFEAEKHCNATVKLVLMDVQTQHKHSGLAAAERIKKAFPQIKIVVATSLVDPQVLERMKAESERFMRDCGYRGILAIEYFIRDGEIYFNEMAPRPHNSGHYTIEGSTTNQFRELVRYLVGEPLQEPRPVAPTVMKNILGQDLGAAEKVAAENLPGVYVHLYGKTECRPKRKMGHITFVGMTAGEYERDWAARFV